MFIKLFFIIYYLLFIIYYLLFNIIIIYANQLFYLFIKIVYHLHIHLEMGQIHHK